mgnify:CR=1 FL=1
MLTTAQHWLAQAWAAWVACTNKVPHWCRALNTSASHTGTVGAVIYATKTLVWDVSENNHAREHAHKHGFAKLVFEAFGKITWTRNSGGEIVGNDEYNRDNRESGGGGNYTTMTFSAAQQKRDKEAAQRNRHQRWY